jgi:head-tail adaptor
MGRMGNQMFQYACAKAFSETFGFYTSLSHLDKLEYFELAPFEKIKNRIKSFFFFRLWKKIWGLRSINTGLECLRKSYLKELIEINTPTTVWGFFQSPEYFESSAEQVRQYFKVKIKYQTDINLFFKQHNLEAGRYIAVHLRRTDYKGFTVPGLQGDDFTLPLSFYSNALKIIDNTEKLPVVFVSDDPSVVSELFPDIQEKIISDNNAITDFLILQSAAQLIVSNSTFAWWAAYLNTFAGNNVYCPQYFLGFKESIEIPVNIYPKHWNQISVF